MNFDDCFSNECSCEKCSEGNSEMTAGYSCQVEQRVWDGCARENSTKAIFLHIIVDDDLCFLHKSLFIFSLQLQNLLDFFA